MDVNIQFTCEAHWEPNHLVIECPSPAARDFVIRAIEDNDIVVKLKKKGKDETKDYQP